jgi:hypothetical protein
MDRIRRDGAIKQLIRVGEQVESCFADAGCPLNPVNAVKCFLDWMVNGAPYDRVEACVQTDWRTGSLGQEPPKFGDLSAIEEDLKLFAGIGLYKRHQANNAKFWEKYGAQVENMCPNNGNSVSRCIDRALGGQRLNVDLERILQGAEADSALANNQELVERLSVFGNQYDVKVFLSLLQYRVMGCGLDLFDSDGNGGIGAAIGRFRQATQNPCALPKCIHYVWTIKDSLCNSCRTSLSVDGIDPFQDVRGFLNSASQEFVNEVSSRSGGKCKARDPNVCVGCKKAADYWKSNNINVLQGFEGEALVVTKLLQDVCNMGDGNTPIQDGQCPDY